MSGIRPLGRAWAISLSTLMLLGCPQEVKPLIADSGVQDAGKVDAGVRDAAPMSDAGSPDAGRQDVSTQDTGLPDSGVLDMGILVDAGPNLDSGFVPNEPCEVLVLPCLDSSRADVYSVPDEVSFISALDTVRAGQTIQIRGRDVGSAVRVPPGVTFHGCDGAEIVGVIGFEGISGTVEGFIVGGGLVVNQTGAYIIRRNRFIADPTTITAIRATAIDGLVGASITLIVEQNSFSDRRAGIEANTRYDTMIREVDIQIRNNIFKSVVSPIRISEAGLVGTIDSVIEHNTFFDFDEAVRIDGIDRVSIMRANLFSKGDQAVAGNAPYGVEFCFANDLTSPDSNPPFSGSIGNADPKFVAPEQDDFRLSWDSLLVDVIPTGSPVPALDYYGCPRPARLTANSPKSDVGALEAQP